MLLPGQRASPPPVRQTARVIAGLVLLPRPHLLPAADDGVGLVPLGGAQPPQELLAHGRVQGGRKMVTENNRNRKAEKEDVCSQSSEVLTISHDTTSICGIASVWPFLQKCMLNYLSLVVLLWRLASF